MEDLNSSMNQYNEQLSMVNDALAASSDETERKSLLELQSELLQLKQLTEESMNTLTCGETSIDVTEHQSNSANEVDDEYALFMQEMSKSGAYDSDKKLEADKTEGDNDADQMENDDDIEDELSTLLGMKCAVYHTHRWGGQPSLYNAMVCAVVPRQDNDQFSDLQVRVLFTHPTHAEMLPCPFYLDGECKFSDEQCRYSHGAVVQLSTLKEAIEPNFESIRIGSRILLKLKPPDDEDISLTKKSAEKYHLWHRAVVKHLDADKKVCIVKLEHGAKCGETRKSNNEEIHTRLEDIFPLTTEEDSSSDSDSLSDTEYPQNRSVSSEDQNRALLIEKSLQNNGPAMGEWERHTRGIGSKLMLAMGYVPGTGLGATGDGRVQPVEARVLPVGKSLDKCMEISEKNAGKDPLKVEQRLKRLQKKEEEKNKRAYEREKEREKRNVFNFLNRTLGDGSIDNEAPSVSTHIKQTSCKDLNVEHFKINEDTRRVEKDLAKLNNSLSRQAPGSITYKTINMQISEKNRELSVLRNKEQQIAREQKSRKDKQKMTVF